VPARSAMMHGFSPRPDCPQRLSAPSPPTRDSPFARPSNLTVQAPAVGCDRLIDNSAPTRAASGERLAMTAHDDHRHLDPRPNCSSAGRRIVRVDDSEARCRYRHADRPCHRPGACRCRQRVAPIGKVMGDVHVVIGRNHGPILDLHAGPTVRRIVIVADPATVHTPSLRPSRAVRATPDPWRDSCGGTCPQRPSWEDGEDDAAEGRDEHRHLNNHLRFGSQPARLSATHRQTGQHESSQASRLLYSGGRFPPQSPSPTLRQMLPSRAAIASVIGKAPQRADVVSS
jgi:hypothetical protein